MDPTLQPQLPSSGQDRPMPPIPGQSLTRTPGQYPFEKPPTYADPEDALEAIVTALRNPPVTEELVDLLELGMPVKGIVQTLIMGGFSEGKWSVDVGMLLIQPVTALVLALCREAKIKPVLGTKPKTNETLDQVLRKRLLSMADEAPDEAEEEGGFMKKPVR